MAKKAAPSAAPEAPVVEAAPEKADPVVLGVEVPLALTVSSAKTIVDAWSAFSLALSTAVKEKYLKKEEPAVEAKPASEPIVASA